MSPLPAIAVAIVVATAIAIAIESYHGCAGDHYFPTVGD